MEIGHSLLTTQNHSSIDSFLYTLGSINKVSLPTEGQTKDSTNGVDGTNMGSTNTIEDNMGRPGIDSNQMPTILSLQQFISNNAHTHLVTLLTETTIAGSYEE
jgi:hypothetical protein